MDTRPIGVFDSGIGGLTVVKELFDTLPHESIFYLGDTARVPYGTKSKETITRCALELADFLLRKNVKALVVACNTISATCLENIRAVSPVPVVDVILPTVWEAVAYAGQEGSIGVIGTRATIASRIYEKELAAMGIAHVMARSCPLFVPLAEEGLFCHEATKAVAQEYLGEFKRANIRTLVLGCTHYPLLRGIIQEAVGEQVRLVDSAKPAADELRNILRAKRLENNGINPIHRFFVTDAPERALQTAHLFFGNSFLSHFEQHLFFNGNGCTMAEMC